ncbi:hypothetical protein VMCG_05019 [Cytospora schulzeri]|uniref:F-box domain-containing protein n=1 Tax=Cytospora schulzeri TaxID=448051 RepID=A0A423WMD2_9PEZI|nr:hypothetical protein VMCG_05019 [Valsa malicola]
MAGTIVSLEDLLLDAVGPNEHQVPWDGRDQEEQAELWYNDPLRTKNQKLEDENMRLKRLLRENGISWSSNLDGNPVVQSNSPASTSNRRRSSRLSVTQHRFPHLPVEVILRIMHYALISDSPIIDPLSKLDPQCLTQSEANRGPQIAMGFLSTSKAYYVEGKQLFWSNNHFVFTNPASLRKFSELGSQYRKNIESVTLRIIARYYDDEKRRHRLNQDYHPELTKAQPLKVISRTKDQDSMARKGFHCYTWTQTVDFLEAMRPPFDPQHPTGTRQRLLPGLLSMRIDFVNFPNYFLPFPQTDLHEIAAHDLGCTLNELTVTGLPSCEVGIKAGADLQGMVKDDGLFVCYAPSYIQQKKWLKPLRGYSGIARVVRAWRKLARERQATFGQVSLASFPVVPEETGHPKSTWKKRKTLWKRVPISRDSTKREWAEFDRNTGEPVDDLVDYGSDESDAVCPNCGVVHGHYDYWASDSD